MSRHVLIMLTALAVVGCGSVAPIPEDQFYRLVATRDPAPLEASARLDGGLFIEVPRASGVRRNRPMLFSPAPYVRFQQYNYHHWEEAPPRLVQHRLLDGLQAIEAAPVITARPTADGRYRLETHLARFERLVEGERFSALVEIRVRLVRIDDPETPLVVGDFRAEEPAADDTMEATAVAFGRAMDDIVAQLADGFANRQRGGGQ